MTRSQRPGLSGLAFACVASVIVFQLACPIVIATQGSHLSTGTFASQSDAARYRAIAQADGTPYRDFDVEYPPGAYGMFRALGPRDFNGFRLRLLALQVACQALIVFLLFRVWSTRAAWSYLVLSTPMLFVVYTSYDLVAVALAVVGAALVRRRHPFGGAFAFLAGAFAKLWPVVLLPGLIVRRQGRAFGSAVAAGIVGVAAWSAWGGSGAVGQVLTYRGARGWQYESLPGSLLRLVTRDDLRFERGGWRVGAPPHAVSIAISAVLFGVLAVIWFGATREPAARDGIPEVAAVTAVLVFGTLLSAQFLIWPLPFAAIAASRGARRLERWAAAASVLTLLDWIWYDPLHPSAGRLELAILGRNVAVVGLLAVAVSELLPTSNRRHSVASHTTL